MGFLDKAKAAAEQAASRANEAVEDVQTKRELSKAYNDLGEKSFELAESGAISHADLQPLVDRVRDLKAKIAASGKPAAEEPAAAQAGGNGKA